MSGPRGTVVESSVPYDPAQGEDIESDLPGDGAEFENREPVDDRAAVEARARDMGWKPLTEYRGPPGQWRDAPEFIERGETVLPIMRDNNRRLTEKVGRLEGEISALRRTTEEQVQVLSDMREMARTASKRGYDQAMAENKAKQRQAVAAGDTDAFDQLVEEAEAMEEARDEAPRPAAPKPAPEDAPPQLSDATEKFLAQNQWFKSDAFLARKMTDLHVDVIQEGEIDGETAQYAEAKKRLIAAYPQQAAAHGLRPPPRQRVDTVLPPSGSRPQPQVRGTATINSIADPTERAQAREAFKRMARQMPGYTEAEYMAVYGDPHADVLEVQRSTRKA